MGLRIGQTIRDIVTTRPDQAQLQRQQRQTDENETRARAAVTQQRKRDVVVRSSTDNKNTAVDVFVERDNTPPERTGFGQGSVSVPSSAVRTLRGGLDSARQLVPSPEEAQEKAAERRAELRDQLQEQQEEARPAFNAAQSQYNARAATAGQVRSFINALNSTAETTDARLRGEEPASNEPQAFVNAGGQSIPIRRTGESGSILNITV